MSSLLVKLFVPDYNDRENQKVRSNVGKLSGIVGIIVNILLASAKITVGLLFGLVSALADGINNLTDCGSNIVSIISFKLSNKSADKEHPYGHQRIEYVSALIVGVIVVILAIELATESIGKIISPEESVFSFWTIGILSASILVKLWLFFFNKNLGKKYNSEMLKATARDSISDCTATLGVLISAIISHYTGFLYLDGIMGLVVAVLIAFVGISILKATMSDLLGKAPDKNIVNDICKRVLSYDGVLGIHDLEVHNYGPNKYYASMHVEVDGKVDVMESHELVDKIERDFAQNTNITLVIHMDPIAIGDPEVDFYKTEVLAIVNSIDERFTIHDFRITKGPSVTNLIFDLAIPYECTLKSIEIKSAIQKEIDKLHDNIYVVPTIERQTLELTDKV